MGRCWFVQPELVRLPLSDGEWIEVRKTLSVGDWFDMLNSLGDQSARKDLVRAQMMAHIVNWSLLDPQGRPAPFSLSALNQLNIDRYHEIDNALSAHIVAQDEVRSAEKNGQDGGRTSSVALSSGANSI